MTSLSLAALSYIALKYSDMFERDGLFNGSAFFLGVSLTCFVASAIALIFGLVARPI
jgi:hypothetical protein